MPKILDDLVACGVPTDTIVAVANLIAQSEQLERRRASNRESMRRARSVCTRVHTSVHNDTHPPNVPDNVQEKDQRNQCGKQTMTAHDVPDNVLEIEKSADSSLLTSSYLTTSQRSKEVVVARKSPRPGTRLPPDFVCDEKTMEVFRAELPGADFARVMAEFRDYWDSIPGQRGVKVDWQATARNRFRQLNGFKPKGQVNGYQQQPRPNSFAAHQERGRQVFNNLLTIEDVERRSAGFGSPTVARIPERPQERS